MLGRGLTAAETGKRCFSSQVTSPERIQRIVQTVVESTAKIIVVFSSDVDLSPLVFELLRSNVTNRTWIASEAWVTSALINRPEVSADGRAARHTASRHTRLILVESR